MVRESTYSVESLGLAEPTQSDALFRERVFDFLCHFSILSPSPSALARPGGGCQFDPQWRRLRRDLGWQLVP
jgi:hypothetical protein